jgi:predicted RNA binding protein YcfA (HicA-like mRNA interferase family)
MAKAARVLAALKRDGWVEIRRSGSHRMLAKGTPRGICSDVGKTIEELQQLL